MFSANELQSISDFRVEHFEKKCYMKKGKSDSYKIKIVSTGIGDNITIKCLCCGKKKDVTDYDRW